MDVLFESNKSMLKSMLLDEERLVTYLSLSKDLCLHVNSSKLLLARLVDNIRHENPDLKLNISFILSGAVENNTARTIICSEPDLSKQKEYFKNIFFEHIYSVSVGHPTIDTAAYLTVNRFEDFMLCSGFIKSKLCDKRTAVEIGDLKSNSQEVVLLEKSKSVPLSSKKIKQETDTTKIGDSGIKSIKSERTESKSEPIVKHELASPKKETTGNNKRKTTNSIVKPMNGNKTQKGIVGFFNKSNNNSNKIESKVREQSCNKKTQCEGIDITSEKMEVDISVPKTIKIDENHFDNNTNNKILNQIKKTSKVDRKRKRVLHVSDSDSDNENNDPFTDDSIMEQKPQFDHDSDDEIPPTPTANDVKITSGFLNTKKRRKIIDKTYTSENGYIVTKKEEVYESCSDKEEDNELTEKNPQEKLVRNDSPPKEKINGLKKKISPTQKGKQSTLTNYFKKV